MLIACVPRKTIDIFTPKKSIRLVSKGFRDLEKILNEETDNLMTSSETLNKPLEERRKATEIFETPVQMNSLVVESTPGEDENFYLSKLQQTLNEMVEMTKNVDCLS
jgi:hypothetical protein